MRHEDMKFLRASNETAIAVKVVEVPLRAGEAQMNSRRKKIHRDEGAPGQNAANCGQIYGF